MNENRVPVAKRDIRVAANVTSGDPYGGHKHDLVISCQ
jgi:hypothetical protein